MAGDDNLQLRCGKRCRALRQKLKLSQLDMVRQKIERGALDVRLSTAEKLAEAFGVTLSELMRGV